MWTLAVGSSGPSGAPTRQLTEARSRRLTFRVDGPAEAAFSINGRSDEAAAIVELESDLWCYRDSDLMFRGRIIASQDDISPNVHTVQFMAVDYRGMLNFRRVVDVSGNQGATFAAVSQATIPWNLIQWTQALSGGNWGITNGAGNTSATNRDRTIEPGKFIGEEIAMIGRLDGGFEWEIDPLLALNRYYPTRGVNNGVVADYGGIITTVRRLVDPSKFANSVLVTGSQGLTPVVSTAAGIGTDPKGRWEAVESFPSIIEQATLNARGPALLAQTDALRPQYAARVARKLDTSGTPTPTSRWEGDSHIWIGDTVKLAVKSGLRNVAANHRVLEMQVAIGENGEEDVDLGLAVPT